MLTMLSKQELLDLENRRYKAMVERDLDTLDDILSSDLTYIHSDAVVDNKEQYMGNLATGKLQYVSIMSQEVQARLYDTFGVLSGIALLHIKLLGQDKHFRMRYTSVYTKHQKDWQMIALQSTGMSNV